MSSYWDYVKRAYSTGGSIAGPGWGLLQAGYNMAYDNSHGSDRYWLSQWPIFSWIRGKEDAAKKAQDDYNNTGKDYAYIQNISGFSGASIGGGSSGAGSVRSMPFSLAELYDPEVVADVGSSFNYSYR